MNAGPIEIQWWQLLLALLFIGAAAVTSFVYRLQLEHDLLWGTLRTFAQLFVMGYALKIIFRVGTPWLVLAIFTAMIFFAARIIRGRVKEREVSFFLPTFLSMTASCLLVSFVVTTFIVGVRPWWKPAYFIPLGGMIIGNSMNAAALSLERLFSELRKRRGEVEMMLCLGADYREASQDMVKNAMTAGMIPSINSMMGVGLVSIPGMMTGQILAGADPLVAIRYQIVVMVMLVGSTAVGSLAVILMARRLCFGPAQELRLRVLRNREGKTAA